MRGRLRQFRQASARPTGADFELAGGYLDGQLLVLFRGQHPRDIVHSAATARWLLDRGETAHHLIVAALLHDVAKGQQRRTDRVAWVLAGHAGLEKRLAASDSGLEFRRAMARSAEHSAAGAAILQEAGAPPAAVQLTRLHHTPPGTDRVLALLQQADAAN